MILKYSKSNETEEDTKVTLVILISCEFGSDEFGSFDGVRCSVAGCESKPILVKACENRRSFDSATLGLFSRFQNILCWH